jgi:hypothetical protein
MGCCCCKTEDPLLDTSATDNIDDLQSTYYASLDSAVTSDILFTDV